MRRYADPMGGAGDSPAPIGNPPIGMKQGDFREEHGLIGMSGMKRGIIGWVLLITIINMVSTYRNGQQV